MADTKGGTLPERQGRRANLPFVDEPEANDRAVRAREVDRAEAAVMRLERLRPQQIRRRWVRWSALVMIGLPALLAGLYYGLIAADQYAVEVRFAVRGGAQSSTSSVGSELFSSLSGMPSGGPTLGDAYIVMDFIRSRELIEKMRPLADVRAVYSHANADFLARLAPDEDIEGVVKYWRTMVQVNFDMVPQIVTVQVRAFSQEDAARVAEGVLTLSEELINSLSDRARLDAVRFAEQEVKRTEDRLRNSRALLRTFRDQQQEIDPLKKAETQLSLLGRVEADLSGARARLLTLRQYMDSSAPSVLFLENQIKSLERQAEAERAKLGKGSDTVGLNGTLSGQVAAYEELLVEREFAEKAYVSALASLERARMDAAQQQRYLATFVRPSLPEDALYPKRLLNFLIVTGGAILVWALSVLVVYAIRDHAG